MPGTLVLDAEGLQADRHAIKIVENNMEEDIDLILAVEQARSMISAVILHI